MSETRTLAVGYARGVAGGMLIGVPTLMTMEFWWEGFFVPAWRLILLYVVNFGVLYVLQHYSGLSHEKTRRAELRAALVAYGIGIAVSAAMLFALGVLTREVRLRDLVGKLILQSVPVSIGASVAMSSFGEDHRKVEQRRKHAGYWGALGMATAGSTLFGYGLAGTEEPLLLADEITWGRAMLLVIISIVQVMAIVYSVDFKQRPEHAGTPAHLVEVLREGISTYAVATLIGGYFLWTFGTLDPKGTGLMPSVYLLVVTGFVTSLGAAAAELLI